MIYYLAKQINMLGEQITALLIHIFNEKSKRATNRHVNRSFL